MAIGFDNSTTYAGVSAASHTFSHTVSGSDRLLVVNVYYSSSTATTVTVTYNGVSATKVGLSSQNSSRVETFYLIAPATGANDVVVTFSPSKSCDVIVASYTGCDQSTQPDTSGDVKTSTPNTTHTATLTPTVVDCWLVAGFRAFSAMSAGTGTSRGTSNNAIFIDNNTAINPAASTSITATTVSANPAGGFAITLAPAAGAPPSSFTPRNVIVV